MKSSHLVEEAVAKRIEEILKELRWRMDENGTEISEANDILQDLKRDMGGVAEAAFNRGKEAGRDEKFSESLPLIKELVERGQADIIQEVRKAAEMEMRQPTLCGKCNLNGNLCDACYANRQTNAALNQVIQLLDTTPNHVGKANEMVAPVRSKMEPTAPDNSQEKKPCCDDCRCPDTCDQPGEHCRFIVDGKPAHHCHTNDGESNKTS